MANPNPINPNPKIELTESQKETAIKMAAEGKKLREIEEYLGVDAATFMRIKKRDPSFAVEISQARNEALEKLADDLITIVDDYQDTNKARVKSDNIKWVLSKRKSEIYGDRLDVNLTQTVDISGALADARARLSRDVTPQLPAITQQLEKRTTGSQPVVQEETLVEIQQEETPCENSSEDIFK